MQHDSASSWTGESGWSSGGGGASNHKEFKPSYQVGVSRYKHRANPDVAYDADPNPGFAVYDQTGSGG